MRHSVRFALIALTVINGLAPVEAEDIALRKYSFEIPRQSLVQTLNEISKQTGLQIAYVQRDTDRSTKIVGPLRGNYTIDIAMRVLLEDSGLAFKKVNETTIAVTDQTIVSENSSGPGHAPSLSTSLGFTGISRSHDSTDVRFMPIAVAGGELPEGRRSEEETKSDDVEGVVVIGSHIRGVENNTVPLTILNREYIESTGLATAARLVESLPQNFSLNSQSVVQGLTPDAIGTSHQGASVSLRGVGQGTTLVLLNGRRLAPGYASTAVDISALPMSAIERVEVLTDGASALYGSDAVGGVVNFVMREDFDGAETRLRNGWADSLNERRFSQVFGTNWDSGNVLVSGEYYRRDLLLAKDRDFVPSASLIGSLLPEEKTYSAMFVGRQNLADDVSIFANALYTDRDSFNRGGRTIAIGGVTIVNENVTVENPQVSAAMGMDWQLGEKWRVEATGSYARNEMDTVTSSVNQGHRLFEIEAAQVKMDGPLLDLPGGSISLAVGAEWRNESYSSISRSLTTGRTLAQSAADQIVRGAFIQTYVPIVGRGNARSGVQKLELSLAGRIDDYSNFGSSFDPQVGLMWEPAGGIRLRASRGSSYKPPNLIDYNRAGISASAAFDRDPLSPSGMSQHLRLFGADVLDLAPQESENTSYGIEFVPSSIKGLRLSLNYYKIEYTDRIASAGSDSFVLLSNPQAYGTLFIRDPSVAQVDDALVFANLGQGLFVNGVHCGAGCSFDPNSVDVIVDLRTRNLSATETSGIDVSMHYDLNIGNGSMQLGFDGTYIDELVQRVTDTSVPVDKVNKIYNPVDWRLRGTVGFEFGDWVTNFFVNYADSYIDNRTATPISISSYTTVDARLAYNFSRQSSGGLLAGVVLSASAQNLFDRDPPATAIVTPFGFDMGFDPTNASPLGRLISVEIAKTW